MKVKRGKKLPPKPSELRSQRILASLKAYQEDKTRELRMAEKAWLQRVEVIKAELTKRETDIYANFHRLVNMSGKQVLAFAKTDNGKKAGLSRSEAAKQGIASGRDRPKQIARLLGKSQKMWTDADYSVAARVVSFISRMKGNDGPIYDDKGELTRKATSLLIWGHDPRKSSSKSLEPLAGAPEMSITPLSLEKGLAIGESIYRQFGEDVYGKFLMQKSVDLAPYKRVIRIQASVPKVDLQNEIIAREALVDGWLGFQEHGAITLEHLGAPWKKEADAERNARNQGYYWDKLQGKTYYEIGRPIPDSFDPDTLTFLAYLYAPGEPYKTVNGGTLTAQPEMANYVWETLHYSPPRVWRASVGGYPTSRAPTITFNDDPLRNIKGKQIVSMIGSFQWIETTLAMLPVNHNQLAPVSVVPV